MTEAEILSRIARRVRWPVGSPLIRGIGDDCAIYRPRGSASDLLFTTDLLIEGTHFLTSTHKPGDIGHKALARGLSDIAAMGGEPQFCLLSLGVPKSVTNRWIDSFYSALIQLATAHGAWLAGGDLSRSERIVCDIVCAGAVPRDQALLRRGARQGDDIYVSGMLGGSALGLATGRGAARRRHLRPEPRVELGKHLRRKLHATAAMDLSDGLSIDLARLCEASGTIAAIDALPIFPGATLEQALHGGEDYELLFTVRPGTRVPAVFHDIPLTRIGTMLPGTRREVGKARVLLGGRPLPALGHDHFRS